MNFVMVTKLVQTTSHVHHLKFSFGYNDIAYMDHDVCYCKNLCAHFQMGQPMGSVFIMVGVVVKTQMVTLLVAFGSVFLCWGFGTTTFLFGSCGLLHFSKSMRLMGNCFYFLINFVKWSINQSHRLLYCEGAY